MRAIIVLHALLVKPSRALRSSRSGREINCGVKRELPTVYGGGRFTGGLDDRFGF